MPLPPSRCELYLMAEDFLELIETELARALRAVDRACMLAVHLKEHPLAEEFQERSSKAVGRALAIREAITEAGVRLPPLRLIEQREKAEAHTHADTYSIPRIARLSGLDREAVERKLRRQGGKIRRKLDEALRSQEPAVFTREEANRVLRGA